MKFDLYTIHDFVLDEDFVLWVQSPDPESDKFWQDWLEQHPEKQQLVSQARALVLAFSLPGKAPGMGEQQKIWGRIQDQIALREQDESGIREPGAQQSGRASLPLRPWQHSLRLVASVSVILAVAGMLFWMNTRRNTVECSTGYGETRQIRLPDGSRVFLNANSTLRFSRTWHDGTSRQVWIQGEAFFAVRKKQSPAGPVKFVVHTRDLDVEVLGTRFNVAQRKAQTQVVLESGKVRLNLNKARPAAGLPAVLDMAPGQLVEYSTAGRRLTSKKIKPALYASWKDGIFTFENTSLARVADLIEQTYGLRVMVADSTLYRETITGALPTDNVDLLLESLALSCAIRIERKDQTVIFHPISHENR